MRTSEAIRAAFPVGMRVVTTDPGYLLVNKGERRGMIMGYSARYEGYVRVNWDEFKNSSSSVPVEAACLTKEASS